MQREVTSLHVHVLPLVKKEAVEKFLCRPVGCKAASRGAKYHAKFHSRFPAEPPPSLIFHVAEKQKLITFHIARRDASNEAPEDANVSSASL